MTENGGTKPLRADVVVIGAGPAGAHAALAAEGRGARVVLIDEASAPGGQIWRASPAGWARPAGPDGAAGEALRDMVRASSLNVIAHARVWSVVREGAGDPFRVDAVGPDGPTTIKAPALISATGATERVVPFPGWTRPGVCGLAAATILLKAFDMIPGRRVVVAGSGPLLFAVAAGILAKGGEVAAVVDAATRREWVSTFPALCRAPSLLAKGLGWRRALLASGVRVHHASAVVAAHGDPDVSAVEVARLDRDRVPYRDIQQFDVDALVVGNGLCPSTEITRTLGASHFFDRALGGWRPQVDEDGATSVPGLFCAGDSTGVRGAPAAVEAGRRAGAAAAGVPMTAARARVAGVGAAMSRLSAIVPAQCAAVGDDTVVCRCEDVTAGEVRDAVRRGAHDLHQLKHFTRCGMGPCQGRNCAEIVGDLAAVAMAGTTEPMRVDEARRVLGQWTGRVPLRPVPLSDLVGDFDYSDIPVPTPAPL